MKKTLIATALLIVLILTVSACGSSRPEPTPAPTPEPTTEPTAVPVEETTMDETTASEAEEATTEESATQAAAFGDAWEAVSCDTFDVAPALAEMADCGYVTVPENRAAGGDATIQLAVVRVNSTSDAPGTPVIYGSGGPGGNGLIHAKEADRFEQTHADILADRDWVMFSQRGTLHAKPFLECLPLDTVEYEAALNNLSGEETSEKWVEATQGCYDSFTAEGVDLNGYNSNENAADINDIRQALAYDKIIYYGISYGTQLGQFLMRSYPEILEAAVLDGIVPVSFTSYSEVTNVEEAFQRVFDACAADEACSAAYPDPEGVLTDVVAELNANPQTVEIDGENGQKETVIMDGARVLEGLFGKVYGAPAQVPNIINQLHEGNYALLSELAPTYPESSDESKLMQVAVNCADDPNMSLDEADVENMADMYAIRTIDDLRQIVAGCQVLNQTPLSDSSDEAVTANIPTLLLNGGMDPVTPPASGRIVEQALPDSRFVIFPTRGHGQVGNPCGVSITDAFMSDPTAELDTSCIEQQIWFDAPHKVAVSSEDGGASFGLTVPEGMIPTVQAPDAWQTFDGIFSIALLAYPAGTSAEDALNDYIAAFPVPLENVEIVDGEPVAGYPTKVVQTDMEIPGTSIGIDFVAFEDEAGAYLISALTQATDMIDFVRQEVLPGLLETVTVRE